MRKPVIGAGIAAIVIVGGAIGGLTAASGAGPAASLCGIGFNLQAGGDTPGGVSFGTIPFTPGFDSQAGSQNLNLGGPNDCATQQTVPPTTVPTTPTTVPTTPTTMPTTVTTSPSPVGATAASGTATASSASTPPVAAGGTSPSAVAGIEANALPNIAPADANGVTNGNG